MRIEGYLWSPAAANMLLATIMTLCVFFKSVERHFQVQFRLFKNSFLNTTPSLQPAGQEEHLGQQEINQPLCIACFPDASVRKREHICKYMKEVLGIFPCKQENYRGGLYDILFQTLKITGKGLRHFSQQTQSKA